MPLFNDAWAEHWRQRWTRPDAHLWLRQNCERFFRTPKECASQSALYDRKYSDDQPRVPAGQSGGGQWTSDGGNDAGRPDAEFGPDRSGWHSYEDGPNMVCSADLRCSQEEIADQLARFSVPGQDPSKPVENLRSYPVYAPVIGQYVAVSDDGLTITNRTREGHIFYDGKVERRATQAQDGAWYVTTRGTGNNVVPGMNLVNEFVGPDIFRDLDRQMRTSIERYHAKATALAPRRPSRAHPGFGGRAGVGGEAYA